jgi:hypothetical protein
LDSLLADQGIVKAHVIAIPSPSLLIPAFWDSEAYRKAAAWDNGYLRVLGDLTLTRIDGFRTNNASSLDLQFTSQAPTRVEYLFWPNEHMEWFDNGQRMIPQIADGLEGLSLPPGSHRLELRYRAPRSELFVWLSFLYAGLLAAAGGYTVVSRFRRGWPKPSGREPGPAPE